MNVSQITNAVMAQCPEVAVHYTREQLDDHVIVFLRKLELLADVEAIRAQGNGDGDDQ